MLKYVQQQIDVSSFLSQKVHLQMNIAQMSSCTAVLVKRNKMCRLAWNSAAKNSSDGNKTKMLRPRL